MLKRLIVVFCFLCGIAVSSALSQTLPSADLLSPGFAKWIDSSVSGDAVHLEVNGSIEELFHIRDLSVLKSLLSQITLESTTGKTQKHEITHLRVRTGGEILSDIRYSTDMDSIHFTVDGNAYSLPYNELGISPIGEKPFEWLETLQSIFIRNSWLERFDMDHLSKLLTSGKLVEQIPFVETGTIQVTEGYSDDGLRLTRLALDGDVVCFGQQWQVTGSIFKPGGSAPKDTAEVQFIHDKDNSLKITLSSKYTPEKGSKNKTGAVTANARVNVNGKIGGYDVTYTFGLKVRNDWSTDGDILSEKLTVTPSLNWTDKTPGRRYQHLNSGSLTLKNVFRIMSRESDVQIISGTDETTVELTMDGEHVIVGSLGMRFDTVPVDDVIPGDGEVLTGSAFKQLTDAYVRKISKQIYGYLDGKTQKKITQGL
ncbi:MAG: hypothetical protein IJ242_16760 [Clostridia bacterium]|nr:hypothetical protein [Clostridia bacterium]